jgi:hypothetical protein
METKTKAIKYLIEPNQQIGSICPGDEQLNILISPTRTKDIAMNSL